jgi:hypothetical protein
LGALGEAEVDEALEHSLRGDGAVADAVFF